MATETKTIRPDDLLVGIGKSVMGKALLYSIIGHFVLTAATSVSLFKDWTVYGIKSPSAINAIRAEENRVKQEEERRKKAEEKAAAQAKAEAEKKAKEAEDAKKKGAAAATNATAAASGDAKVGADGKIVPPEVQPLPPKKEFEYGDDLSLD